MIVPALIARTQTIIEMTSPLKPLISRPVKAANARKRIIPAGAGNSMKPVMSNPVIRDHPRRRGELTNVKDSVTGTSGSSPQARGTRPDAHPADIRLGIIPAGAGNSLRRCLRALATWDHPRRRGELTWIPLGSMYLIVVKRFTLDNNRESLV